MSAPTDDNARARIAADLAADERDYPGRSFMLIYRDDLKALLAGPPEPSVEEVATLIDDAFSEHGFGAPFFAAKAVQALYRSAGAPQPKEPSA